MSGSIQMRMARWAANTAHCPSLRCGAVRHDVAAEIIAERHGVALSVGGGDRQPSGSRSPLLDFNACWVTVCGRRGSTRRMAFCTSTCAWSILVPDTKVASMEMRPEERGGLEVAQPVDAVQLFFDRLGDALIDFLGRGSGNEVEIESCGGATLGYCAMGMKGRAMRPAIEMKIATPRPGLVVE